MTLKATFVFLMALPAFCQTFFPTNSSPADAATRYSIFLRAMHEPSLYELSSRDPNVVEYRLLWLRERDRPVCVRFAPRGSGSTAWFYRRVTNGSGANGPGGLHDNGMSFAFKGRVTDFLKLIEGTGYWNLPEAAPSGGACASHWIMEGVKNGQYRVIDRCGPDANDPVRIIGALMLKLGSVRLYGSKVY